MNKGVILVVGDVHDWLARGRTLPEDDILVFCDYADFDLKLLRSVQPDVILSPLVARQFDALDIATALEEAHFPGDYRVLTPKLPNPELITKELKNLAPSVDCGIMQIGKDIVSPQFG